MMSVIAVMLSHPQIRLTVLSFLSHAYSRVFSIQERRDSHSHFIHGGPVGSLSEKEEDEDAEEISSWKLDSRQPDRTHK
jgi:hypothetical protein